ncbi:MAG: antibiotic biosynthesis monooxygenase [Acidobacteriota bacterium]
MYLNNASFWISPGNEARAYAAFSVLAAQVEQDQAQPGTWMYLVHTPNLDPGVDIFPPPAPLQVFFVEGYKDRAAYGTHHTSPIMKEFIGKTGPYLLNMYGPSAPFFMGQTLEMIDGFIRPEADKMTAWQVEERWVMKPGSREKVIAALKGYVDRVRAEEPKTLMYTVSLADTSPQAVAIPPSQHDALVYNASWTDKQAFLDHGNGAAHQDFLKEHGELFVQAGPGSTHPYMTTSVLKRFAGFFRKAAFNT